MSRIAILTFTGTLNYGALFQSFALQRVLESLGHEAKLLDYRCRMIDIREKPGLVSLSELRSVRAVARKVVTYKDRTIRSKRFQSFEEKYCGVRVPAYNLPVTLRDFDAVVVGSDQVWNLTCTGGDMSFFLPSRLPFDQKKISYAASFGDVPIPYGKESLIAESLRRFDGISVREQSGAEMVKNLVGVNAEVVLDPTLLLRSTEWASICNETKANYVFVYTVKAAEKTISYAKRIAEKLSLPLVVVKCYGRAKKSEKDIVYENSASPERFLSLIKGAVCVCTSSFHGFCLSLLLHKDVWYCLPDDIDKSHSRITNLAEFLDISDRNAEKFNAFSCIDFANIDEKLSLERKRCISFIEEGLKS